MEIIYFIIIWLASMLTLYLFMKRKQKNRINEILDLIQRLYKQDYTTPMAQDEFSILEDEIYKVFISLVEEKENVRELSLKQIENLENIAHQIKSPITSILMKLEKLSSSHPDNEDIDNLITQVKRLNLLSDSLLKLSSLEVQIDNMNKESFLVSELIDYSLEILELDIKNSNIIFDIDIGEEIIVGDFYWLSEAFINIIKNALKLKNCKIVKIYVEQNPISTSIFIEDDGGGLDTYEKKNVFRRFYKSPDSEGFGIGLAMAKSIILANNGYISVENKNKGASFLIKLYNVT